MNEVQITLGNCKNSLPEGKKLASAFIIVMIEKTRICLKQNQS